MRTLFILAAVFATLAHSQESKPESKPAKGPHKPESAPVVKPVEFQALGRTVALSVPPDWKADDQAGTFALDAWKHAKGWHHPSIRNFAIHVYGVEGKDLTPSGLVKTWLDAAGKAKVESLVSVPGRNKLLKGLDTEIELSENGALSFYWMRAIAVSGDRLLLVLVEACPLKLDLLEEIVDTSVPILDSVLDPQNKDPWRRDPEWTLTRGPLTTKLRSPAGWTYSRDGEGWFGWIGPVEGQTVQLAFPALGFSAVGESIKIPPAEIFTTIVSGFEEEAGKDGKLVSKTKLAGHDQGAEIVATTAPSEEAPGEWSRMRFFLDGSHIVMVTATHPMSDATTLPPDAYQKQVGSALDSFKVELKSK